MRILELQMDGTDWSAEQEYRVATNSMLAGGGHRQKTFTQGREVQQRDSQYETIKRNFQQQQTVAPPDDIRIRPVKTKDE